MAGRTISFIGDGGWGTALACLVADNGHNVTLWGNFPEISDEIRRTRRNEKFLPGVAIPDAVTPTNDIAQAASADVIVFSTPVVYIRSVAEKFSPFIKQGTPVACVSKGIERGTLLLGSQVLSQVLSRDDVGVIFGPSHAEEVVRRLPATVVAAARNQDFARDLQRIFMNENFRVYTSADTIGVEVGAAVKNVIAIAAGICDGLKCGDNAKAALLTRGLAEIARLGVAMGARPVTFAGLSGLGDLITTCISPHGRNLRVGRMIGAGKNLEQVLKEMAPLVPEGVFTTTAVCELARRHNVEMPIAEAVRAVLFENKDPALAAKELMTRDPKPELR